MEDKSKNIPYDIVKSENDNRSYRRLKLKNYMKVLLISDPTTDKAAAALDVNIGNLYYIPILLYCVSQFFHPAYKNKR